MMGENSMIKNPVFIGADPIDQVKGLFESLILQMISTEGARDSLHFKYISPEWAGNPGWYFWPKSRPGVYFLRLESASCHGNQLASRWQLYYYPHPKESVFDCYSLDEQLARLSDLFPSAKPESACCCECSEEHGRHDFSDLPDGAGIPSHEIRERLNSWLFCVGDMGFAWESEKLERYTFEAPEVSLTWAYMDIFATDQQNHKLPLLSRYETDRKIPAWNLCNEFATSLLSDFLLLNIVATLQQECCDHTAGIYRKRIYSIG